MLDASRFGRLLGCLANESAASSVVAASFRALASAYGQVGRAYHDGVHIAECLSLLDQYRHLAARADEVEAALWFHDVVYDPRGNDNESRSAGWAQAVLSSIEASAEVVERIATMIFATCHLSKPIEIAQDLAGDVDLLLDIDLSVLGSDTEAYARYEHGIRQEYAWVPDQTFRERRAGILESFLHRSAIYRLSAFRERFEGAARVNLARSIDSLRS